MERKEKWLVGGIVVPMLFAIIAEYLGYLDAAMVCMLFCVPCVYKLLHSLASDIITKPVVGK